MPYALRDAYGHEYPVGAKMQIGRDRTNQVSLTDPQASRVHATVWGEQGTLYLRDEHGANGTLVNGKPVQQTGLRPGDQILIGNTTLFVVQTGGPAGGVAAPAHSAGAKKTGKGCGRGLLVGCLVLGLGAVVLAVGGFVVYRSGLLTVDTVLNLVGLGPGDVEVDNFRDDTIQVAIVQVDVPAGSLPTEISLEINSFDIRTYPCRTRDGIASTSAAAGIAGCAPVLTVQNNSSIPVRVVVRGSGNNQVLSPSPGESSSAEEGEGAYSAYAIPDAEWIEYARLTRRYLGDQLANADNLTGAQRLKIV